MGGHGAIMKQENTPSDKVRRKSSPKKSQGGVDVLDTYHPTLPLIDGETRADYESFHASCLRAVKPNDAIERVWLQDFIDYTWEAQRLRRMKAALIQANKRDAVKRLIKDFADKDTAIYHSDSLSREWSSGDHGAAEYVEALFHEHDLTDASVMAKAVENCLPVLERIDKLINAYDYRRDAALRELEKRRDLLAKRARDFTNSLLPDAEVTEVKAAE